MAQYFVAYLFTVLVFLGIDFVWLTQVANGFYADKLGGLLLDKPNLGAAAAFYLVYVVGIVFFAVVPALKSGSIGVALINGALLGLIAYGTYDMSNYATLKNWSLTVTVVDMVWGAVLTGVSAMAGYWLTRFVMPH